MDQHHSHHYHRARYAPLPSHHHHHHHHHQNPNHLPPPPPPPSLPPPPQPPPPPPTSHHHHSPYRTPPPPPPHSQFPPNFIDPLPRRSLPDFDQSSWNPNPNHRVLPPDNRPPRNYPPPTPLPPSDYDREPHHRSLDRVHLPPPPPPQYHHQPIEYDHDDGSSRFRLEPMDVYESNPREIEREEFLRVRGGGGDGNYHRGRDFGSKFDLPGQVSRDSYVDPKPEGYVYVYDVEDEVDVARGGSRRDVESKRWVSDRNGPRVPRDSSSFEFGNKEIGAAGGNIGNDFRVVSGKRDYYGNELGRYNNGRGNSRERAHEFTRTPPHKQVQKKSALLRLQTIKPNHRNRENEQSRYPGYGGAENNPSFFRGKEQHQAENNSSFFRGKEQHQHGYLGHGHGAKAETREEREGSPVELDISFESNSLVAKAKVAPSGSVVVCDTNNMTPVSDTDLGSSEKRKKVSVSDSDCSGLPAELSTDCVSLDNSPCKANDTSTSAKDLSLQKNVSDTHSPPPTSVTDNSHGKNEVTLSDGTANVCAEKSSPMVVKKKKIVKRVVKKVARNVSSAVSNSLQANTPHGTVQTDSVAPGLSNSSGPGKVETCLKEKSTTANNVPLTDCLHSLPIEENVLPEDKKEDLSLPRLGPLSSSLDCKTDGDSDIGKLAIFEGGTNISNIPSCVSSSEEDKQIDSDCLAADNSVHALVGIPHTDTDTKSLNGNTFSEINDVLCDNKQLCKNEVSLSPWNCSNVGSPQNRYPVDRGDEMNCKSFSSADIIGNTDLINTCDSVSDRVFGLNSSDLTGSAENFTVSDSGNAGNVGKAYYENKAPTITHNPVLDENTDSAIPLPSSGMVALSSNEKTRIKEVSDCVQHVSALELGSDNQSASSEDSMTVQCCDTVKQVPPSDGTISPENCDREETLSNLNISVGFDEGNVNMIKKIEVNTQLDFLSSKTEGISPDPENSVSYANDVDRASNLLKDPCSSPILEQSVQSLDLNSRSSTDDEVTAIQQTTEVSEAQCYVSNNCNDNAKKVSQASKKKRKIASHPSFGRRRSELSDAIVVTTSCAEVPSGFIDNQTHDKEGTLPSMGVLSIDKSIPHSKYIDKLPDRISKARTWRRPSSAPLTEIKPAVGTVPPKRPTIERKGNFQNTSYIRKGNSLMRKPSPVSGSPKILSANPSPSFGLDKLPKNTRSESGVNVTEFILKTGVTNAPQPRHRTPPAPIDTKSEENISSPLVEPPSIVSFESKVDPGKLVETNDVPTTSEDAMKHYESLDEQTGPSKNGENQSEANDENISSLNTKRIVYIKPKTNQLVATSSSHDVSVATDGKALTTFSDSYYKKSKNQLVRTTFEHRTNQTVPTHNSTVNTDVQVCKVLCNRRFSKRRSHKVSGSSCKPLRASLVWTLRGKNSSKSDSETRHYQKVLPHLFPWKRTTYLRGFIHNYASNSNPNSLSAISKKLLLLRKRDTVYTRSTHGFSLWKSKVLGVGGSSLKWSKSIEKNSKQANEQATLAVAAVERKKREQEVTACIGSQAKRERIFRIGSVRYRMDSSRRTLQRISDDEPQSSASIPSGLTAKRAYIPRRLVIGNDEYVRIGNGNQLIRDPKKRTRKLANEKVRWSLHTARQRLARKQKYCQFFTRFGKCNKDGGKCPYIHDSSKIAVCTKFLNGLCSASNCKLTHKVIPERMPDCSYFLQGLCTNKVCPYRHVNVNPKASICEGFLKGYCADGNECRKKHSYVCPAFEATGTCSEGTKCKLHHPKKQSKGKKRKRSEDQNQNTRGRYFGSSPIDASEPGMTVAPRQRQQKDDNLEELPDFIGLDVDDDDDVDEEIGEIGDESFEQAMLCDSDSLDLRLDNFDEHIKPVLIMKSEFTPQSSQSPARFW